MLAVSVYAGAAYFIVGVFISHLIYCKGMNETLPPYGVTIRYHMLTVRVGIVFTPYHKGIAFCYTHDLGGTYLICRFGM